jgi:hypothetical protein
MRHLLPAVALALLAGCMKDDALPPATPNTGTAWLAPEMRFGTLPFELHHGYLHGPGSRIHFTEVKVLLSDFRVAGPAGQSVAHLPDAAVMIAPGAVAPVHLGTVPAVALGDMHFQLGLHAGLDRLPMDKSSAPLGDPDMLVDGDPQQGRYTMRMAGFVDLDGDGIYTLGADTAFCYRPYGHLPAVPGHVAMAPVVLRPGGTVVRSMTLDVMDLLLGIDVLAGPHAQGTDSIATELLWNLALALR